MPGSTFIIEGAAMRREYACMRRCGNTIPLLVCEICVIRVIRVIRDPDNLWVLAVFHHSSLPVPGGVPEISYKYQRLNPFESVK